MNVGVPHVHSRVGVGVPRAYSRVGVGGHGIGGVRGVAFSPAGRWMLALYGE